MLLEREAGLLLGGTSQRRRWGTKHAQAAWTLPHLRVSSASSPSN